jgi:hypothetical protein
LPVDSHNRMPRQLNSAESPLLNFRNPQYLSTFSSSSVAVTSLLSCLSSPVTQDLQLWSDYRCRR